MPDLKKFALGSDEPRIDSQGVTEMPPKDVVDEEVVVGLHALVKQVRMNVEIDALDGSKISSEESQQAPQPEPTRKGYKTPQLHITRKQIIKDLRYPELAHQTGAVQTSLEPPKFVTQPQEQISDEDKLKACMEADALRTDLDQKPQGGYKSNKKDSDNA